jgi:hypothetical protein
LSNTSAGIFSITSGSSKKEGLYEQEEGKILEYKDRISD